ncbi:hypothetical protein [Paenibacillus naphthalenovorans]|uniref:hypothetical protein n=1 Tax=Paenibacillus naphthalenovorans TaxID=162209 RepID=UPI003D2C202B
MAWTAEIFDSSTNTTYDITNRIIEISGEDQLGAESNRFSVSCKGIDIFHKLHIMTVRKNGVKRYSGFIINQTDSDKGYKHTEFECVDWTHIFNNRILAEVYNSTDQFLGRPDLIIKDIISKKAPELTTNNIRQVNYSIETIQFPYDKLMDAMSKVMDFLPTWYWYVDPDKDVHLFNYFESEGVTFSRKADGRFNFLQNSLSVKYIGEAQANRIWIIGAKRASGSYIDVFYTANGVQRYFGPLPYEPNYTEIYLNDLLMESKLEQNDDQQQDFLINKAQRIIQIPPNITTPWNGTIKVRFRPTIQVIDYFENAPSVKQNGLFEKAIKSKDITDRMSARQFGKAEIKRKSTDRRIITLSTYEDVKVGQKCNVDILVNDPIKGDWDVRGSFLVSSVRTSVTTTESFTQELRQVEMEEIVG